MTDIIERLEHAAYAWEYGLTVCGDYMPSPAMMREAKLEIEALRKDAAELVQLRALVQRAIKPLEWYAEYLNEAPIWHCTGHEANTVNPLLQELRAAMEKP